MPPKKKRKNLTSEEVLKDIQKFLDEEDNENIKMVLSLVFLI